MKRICMVLIAAVVAATTVLWAGVASAQDNNENGKGKAKSAENEGGGAAEVARKKGKKRQKTVRQDFTNTQTILIPITGTSGPGTTSAITVATFDKLKNPKITDVNVVINNWTENLFAEDVDVLLQGPGGQNAIVLSDVCAGVGGLPNPLTLTLDDQAANSIPLINTQCTTGTFKPTNNNPAGDPDTFQGATASGNTLLSIFNNTSPIGNWQLFTFDDTAGGSGQFTNGFSLQITAKGVVKKKKKGRR